MLPYIVGPALDPITKVSIVDLMNKYNVHQRPSTALQEVKPDCFVVKNPDGSMEEGRAIVKVLEKKGFFC